MGWAGSGNINGINAEGYGVKADGTDVSAALQALIDDRNVKRKYPILLPTGLLVLGTPIIPKSDVAILGVPGSVGYGFTTLRPSGDFPAFQSAAWTGGGDATRITLSDVTLSGNNLIGGTAYLLDLRRLFASRLERVFLTSDTSTKQYRGLRMFDCDSVSFFDCQITECRDHAFVIGARNQEIHFYACNFESDSGVAINYNKIDSQEWFGTTPSTNSSRGITFHGFQLERMSIYINTRDVVMDGFGREQSNVILGRRSARCRISASGNYPTTVIRDYGTGNDISLVGAANVVTTGPRAPLLGELADPYVVSGKTTQRSVYGVAGQEFLLWHHLRSSTLTSTSQSVSVTTQPSGATLETSDSHNFENANAQSFSLDGKDGIAWVTCQTIASGDDELRSAPSAGSALFTAAYRNLLENGDLSDDSSGDPPTGWSKQGTFTGAYSSGWFQMGSPGSDIGIYQDLPLGAGQYMALARVKGSVALCLGSAWSGTDGNRAVRDAYSGTADSVTDYFGTGDTLLQIFWTSDGNGARISLGWQGATSVTPEIRWVAVVRIDQTPKYYANNPPTSTSRYWRKGEVILDAAPDASGTMGWVCTTAGKPGTWKTFGAIAA